MVAACLLAAVALITSGCTQRSDDARMESDPRPATSGGSAAPATSLDWAPCRGKLTSQAGLQCATLAVPIDPSTPDGPTLDLALARKKSTGSADERIGSLVMNPGGPGGSGLEFLANASMAFPSSLTDRFDLVSFDPRGVGESDPVRCLDDDQKDEQLEGDLSPDDDAERAHSEAQQAELRKGCETRNPDLVTHMSTADVAADMDRIRAAVGDEKLNYLGYSYGTAIGATYAAKFPANIRAMVLDGSVSPSASVADQAMVQATGFERTLGNFVTTCDADKSCALAPDTAAAIESTRRSLEEKPVEVKTGAGTRTLTSDLFDYGLDRALRHLDVGSDREGDQEHPLRGCEDDPGVGGPPDRATGRRQLRQLERRADHGQLRGPERPPHRGAGPRRGGEDPCRGTDLRGSARRRPHRLQRLARPGGAHPGAVRGRRTAHPRHRHRR